METTNQDDSAPPEDTPQVIKGQCHQSGYPMKCFMAGECEYFYSVPRSFADNSTLSQYLSWILINN
jgi:hypothetical protein